MKFELILGATLLSACAFGQAFTEKFDDVADGGGTSVLTSLLGRGWAINNASSPVGTTSWFAGQPSVVGLDQNATTNLVNPGANVGYIAANFLNVASSGTISDYLIAPTVTLHNGDTFSFETVSEGSYPDNLEVVLSTNGSSTAASDFSTVLLQINPTLASGTYPTAWKDYTVTVSGLSAATTGRLAFHYSVANGGLSGANSSYIGVDNAVYNLAPVPEPASLAVVGLGLVGLVRRRRNK